MRHAAALLAASVMIGAGPRYSPPKSVVTDAATAVRIAEAALVPAYGAGTISSEKPFFAKRDGDIWTVTGTLPPGRVGGVATVKIARRDGRVLYMMHGK